MNLCAPLCRPVALSLCAGLVGLLVAGCGAGGPQRTDLSGNVTYQGEPVAAGKIYFTPDAARGNSGPGSFAEIREGRYATTPGHGIVGGAYRVRIVGYDTPPAGEGEAGGGEPLFAPRQIEVDLPKEGGTFDLVVSPGE